MKGQTQALTAILITTVTIAAISAAYVWGTPLLEKRESKSELNNIEEDVMNLHSSIISTSKSGSGTTNKVELSLGDGELTVNESQDYIEIEVASIDPPYPAGTWTLIKGSNLQNLSIVNAGKYGIKGRDLPGVVAVKALSSTQNAIIRYRVDFRNMRTDSPASVERIDLKSRGSTRASGDIRILLSNRGTERDSNAIISGSKKLDRVRKVVEVDIQ